MAQTVDAQREPVTGTVASRGCTLDGQLTDAQGGVLQNAEVTLLSASAAPLARAQTDQAGRFSLSGVSPGVYLLEAFSRHFARARELVRVEGCPIPAIDIRLARVDLSEAITVTAVPADSRHASAMADMVTVTDEGAMAQVADALVPRMLRGELGVSVQQTTTSQASPFVRGLTGQHVVGLIDGVRFNTATFRPGANQYLAFIDGGAADRIEVVRGPGAVAYGSDSMGGTVNVLTKATGWGRPRFGVEGGGRVELASADRSAGAGVTTAGGSRRWGFFADATLRSHDDLRTGRSRDSRSVATRLLGLPSAVLGDHLAQTAFRQESATLKVDTRPAAGHAVVGQYMHSRQDGASRYDQLDGGAGNLLHAFDPQGLDFGILRYDRSTWGPLDTLTARASYNRQIDDRTYQNINNSRLGLRSPISAERNATRAVGAQLLASRARDPRHRFGAGLEMYDEAVASSRQDRQFDVATANFTTVVAVRPRYPDAATFRTFGAFAQYTWDAAPDRLTLAGSARYSRFTYTQGQQQTSATPPALAVLPYRSMLDDWTYQASAVWQATRVLAVTAQASRGFRAPNINDRGSVGLSGNGLETSPEEGAALGGRYVPFGATTAANAPAVSALDPEVLWNYEVGVRVRRDGFSASVGAFRSDLANLVERNVILLAPGAVGTSIAGEPIVRQDALGAVYTALASSPVFVRTNAGPVRLQGAEAMATARITDHLVAEGNASYIRGEDLSSGRPPGLENGIPPLHGSVKLRWTSAAGRWWAEGALLYAAAQTRLSANDIAQPRIGGYRTATEIANFFNNGAVARGLVRDGVLLASGESLPQVVDRVLGPAAATGAPLYTQNDGFAVVSIATGLRFGRHAHTIVAIDNLGDTNYRVMGSGVDGPGVNLRVLQTFRF
jgi:outer membrane receptor protein involved in Fe transport